MAAATRSRSTLSESHCSLRGPVELAQGVGKVLRAVAYSDVENLRDLGGGTTSCAVEWLGRGSPSEY